MSNNQARDLFQLQSELVDTKVDMAVSKAIDRVVDQITGLKSEMHREINTLKGDIYALKGEMHYEIGNLRADMTQQFSVLGQRVSTVESAISFMKDTQGKINTKLIEYTFRAIWLILGGAVLYIIANFIKMHTL